MSTIEELKTQIKKIKTQISNRKNEANELKLSGKISEVARIHGNSNDWGEGRYVFSEKGLSIVFESNYVRVNLGYETEDVFNANLLNNDVGEIYLYIPGEWEKRIEELYSQIPEIKQKWEISNLQCEINRLKKEWKLGDDN